MSKVIKIKSDMSNVNTLTLIKQDDGDVVLSIYAPKQIDGFTNADRGVEICTRQGGSRLTHNTEILKHLYAIMDLLEPDSLI